jgi:hypothetical protein
MKVAEIYSQAGSLRLVILFVHLTPGMEPSFNLKEALGAI